MEKLRMLKRVLAFTLTIVLSAGIFISSADIPATLGADSESYDVSEYAEKLQSIAEEQKKLDEQIKAAEKDIENELKEQKLIKEKIDTINEKIEVLNSYMTTLEMDIASNQRLIDSKQKEIEDGVEKLKKRIRAMYLAGEDSYTTIILESGSFYDILMRIELIKRVANHDNSLIDGLVASKEEYEKAQERLEAQKAEYDNQYKELESQKTELDKLYNSSEKQKQEYEKQKAALEKQNEEYIQERKKFEDDLSGVLTSTYGNSADETARAAAELSANQALKDLRNDIEERISDGENIPDTECRFEFGWPVPGCYYITSGVGARWGTYHTGLDISGSRGTNIHATESGTVIRTNSSCPHNYGKEKSCGCGGGYGNYVIIDHGGGFISLYGHMTALNVKSGDTVKKGDVIGIMGSTGYSTGDHLHFEIRYQGMYLNPAAYVNMI